MIVWLAGCPGVGKSTLAKKISVLAGIKHVEVDRLRWTNDWEQVSRSEFEKSLFDQVDGQNVVIDGYYQDMVEILIDRVDCVVLVETTYLQSFLRLLKRTAVNIVTRKKLFNGRKESILRLFGNESIFKYWNYYFRNVLPEIRALPISDDKQVFLSVENTSVNSVELILSQLPINYSAKV